MTTAIDLACPTGTTMTPEQRVVFERDGYLVVPDLVPVGEA